MATSSEKENICGWCSQQLDIEHTEAHFEKCTNPQKNDLLMVYKQLRIVNQKIDGLKADEGSKLDEMKAEMLVIKTKIRKEMEIAKKDFDKQILDLKSEMKRKLEKKCGETRGRVFSTLFGKLKGLEAGMAEKMREMNEAQHLKMMEVNGRVSQVEESVSSLLRTILEQLKEKVEKSAADTHQLVVMGTLSERVKSNDGDLRVIKTQLKDEQGKNEASKKDLESSPSVKFIIPMNRFNLSTRNYLFQPSLRWIIGGIEAKLSQETFEVLSEMFQWFGFPVQARAKLQLKEDDYVYVSLVLNEMFECVKEAQDLTLIPTVYYLLKSKAFDHSLEFDQYFVHKSWFKLSTYNINDSVEIEVYVEPAQMTRQVYSYDGTLDWVMEDYSRRLQLEKDGLVLNQESPYFYTGPNGFRVKAEMRLNGDKGAGGPTARILVLPGKFDAQLPESFFQTITVTLINRKNLEHSVNKTHVWDIKKKADKFEICKFKAMENVIVNDALFCKVVVKPH